MDTHSAGTAACVGAFLVTCDAAGTDDAAAGAGARCPSYSVVRRGEVGEEGPG